MSTSAYKDYFRMNNNIFDTETDENGKTKLKLSAVQIRVLAVLYSLAPFGSYKVKVRQSVLAQKCGCSVSTIKRAISDLLEKGYINAKARTEFYKDNERMLGTYTYILPHIAKKGYFYVSRKALALLSKTQTRVYLFICKCIRSKTKDCWNSFNDIADKLKLHRNSVVKCIKELVELKVISKWHNYNRNGSFNDNTYKIVDIETMNSIENIDEENNEYSEYNSASTEEVYANFTLQDVFDEYVENETAEKEELPLSRNDSSNRKVFENRNNPTIFNFECTPFWECCQANTDIFTKNFYCPRAGP